MTPPDQKPTTRPPDNRPPARPQQPTKPRRMTPAEYGRWLARQLPPITDEQAHQAARILASVLAERQAEVAA